MMKKLLLVFLMSMGGVTFAHATDLSLSNAGFAQSNIWYSKDPFYTGDKVRVYTVVFNGTSYGLTGAVEFLDNGTSIGKTNFSISGGGRAQDSWVDWKAGEGKHTIAARLVNVVADGPNGKQSVSLPNAETGTSDRTIDINPAIKEAQAKADTLKIVEAGTQTAGKIDGAIQTVGDAVPAPVKDGVLAGVSAVENFRTDEASQLGLLKNQKSKEVDAIAARTKIAGTSIGGAKKDATMIDNVSNAAEKPLAYAMLAAVGALQFIFEWKVVFYGIILYALYRVIKWVVYKIRNR